MVTYKLISSVTVGSGGAANIEFTSIPATYTDLVIKLSSRNNIAGEWDNLDFRMNSLSTSIYNSLTIYATGSGGAGYGFETNQSAGMRVYAQANGTTASTFGNVEFYFPNYTSSNNKSVSVDYVSENNGTSAIVGLSGVTIASSAAITSLSFFSRNAANFMQNSTAYLYGISNA
jgi:hypothetical protein